MLANIQMLAKILAKLLGTKASQECSRLFWQRYWNSCLAPSGAKSAAKDVGNKRPKLSRARPSRPRTSRARLFKPLKAKASSCHGTHCQCNITALAKARKPQTQEVKNPRARSHSQAGAAASTICQAKDATPTLSKQPPALGEHPTPKFFAAGGTLREKFAPCGRPTQGAKKHGHANVMINAPAALGEHRPSKFSAPVALSEFSVRPAGARPRARKNTGLYYAAYLTLPKKWTLPKL